MQTTTATLTNAIDDLTNWIEQSPTVPSPAQVVEYLAGALATDEEGRAGVDVYVLDAGDGDQIDAVFADHEDY